MSLLKSLVCAEVVMIVCYVVDALLILGALGLFLWYYIKNSKKTTQSKNKDLGKNIEKVDDDTYVLAQDVEEVPEPEIQKDNAVEHFVNQISDINEETNNEHSSSAVVVRHEVEPAVKKVPRKDEIQNYVMIGGVKKEKTAEEKVTSFNRGSDAFKNSTNFLNTIKNEQATKVEKEKTTTAKSATKPATSSTKTTTNKKTATN